jgi:hypothetical protein
MRAKRALMRVGSRSSSPQSGRTEISVPLAPRSARRPPAPAGGLRRPPPSANSPHPAGAALTADRVARAAGVSRSTALRTRVWSLMRREGCREVAGRQALCWAIRHREEIAVAGPGVRAGTEAITLSPSQPVDKVINMRSAAGLIRPKRTSSGFSSDFRIGSASSSRPWQTCPQKSARSVGSPKSWA